ncbi:DNA gyrase inhibitor YacG [Halobacteriovorax sp. HLS]|uniref:DNA gyrase inhibitor YacG n=1 Tax=Halobacteriovorax sp. HLS TaxID=2234000 RepID=UPI000FDCBDC1|nr:DNA gyrase inhibitor YacG [Halobacteriovorax sp. HLS]
MVKILKVNCPNCKKEFNYYHSDFRPFCSERCKMVDMGHWLNEGYTVPVRKSPDEELNIDEFEIDEADQGFGNFYDEE